MGGKLGIFPDPVRRVGPINLNARDYEILKKLWVEIEDNPQRYSRGIYIRFFALFPQYVKYFVEDKLPPNEKFNRINDIFVRILSTMGYLILDFYKKPKMFDIIVGYLAMVHQDMYLNVGDVNNFSYAIIQYLQDVVPHMMTDECITIFTDFMADLTHQIVTRMVKCRAEMDEDIANQDRTDYTCRWFKQREKVIYGQAQSYWITRRHKWEVKRQRWKENAAATEPSDLANLFDGSDDSTDSEERRRTSSPRSQVTEPHAQGSVTSEILQGKIGSPEKKQLHYSTETLRSRSSQILAIGRQSPPAAIVSADTEAPPLSPSNLPTARERFRNRRMILEDYRNEPSTSNNQEFHPDPEGDEKVGTEVATCQRRREFSIENGGDKTDH